MGFFSKFLAGGLGWALGGPIGAIIGVVLASIDSWFTKSLPNDRTRTYRSKPHIPTSECRCSYSLQQ